MAKEILNTVDLSWAQAVFKLADKVVSMQKGDILEVVGNHQDFEKVIGIWCDRLNKQSLCIKDEGKNVMTCQILF